VIKAEIKSLKKNETFEITFLSSEKIIIDSRWVFKCKKEAVSIVEQTADNDHNHKNVDNLLSKSQAAQHQQEQELMKIKTYYKTCLVVRDFEQQYEVDYWAMFFSISCMTTVRMLLILAVYYQ
jgi:predicted metal-binding protein